MSSLAPNSALLKLSTTPEIMEILTRAAALEGLDLPTFLLGSAMERARAILRDHVTIALAVEAQTQLTELLHAQPEPTEAMRELRRLPRLMHMLATSGNRVCFNWSSRSPKLDNALTMINVLNVLAVLMKLNTLSRPEAEAHVV